MEYKGSSAYEKDTFFTNYMKRRNRKESPNNAIEKPIMYALIGDVTNLDILDLGCGDASFGVELLDQGAATYHGVEGSSRMADAAQQNLAHLNGLIHRHTMEQYLYPKDTFNLVTSRFAIHYVEKLSPLFEKIYQTLKHNGTFVFSVQHPLTTASFKSKTTSDRRDNWIVDDYFLEGERKEPWINETVIKYHHTIEHYFTTLRAAGFTITDLREGKPLREHFTDSLEYERRQRIPLVLAFCCRKS
ncbi:methyltransferase type 11 [Fictibacillus macauensis ZFHKF-1]|uniref:Methyltransferase type 11 n=1 Tax=Fictibacillus macauensis ZFHKF-1 TaxID=1196324 RepID=I8AEG3_9BACL|nr:methyltransferase domain-containing protein [Fictibacillus macauensis]EIT83952.1 methyltransferase type 11 [Fictibacillus macauensis ZFHKF-1]